MKVVILLFTLLLSSCRQYRDEAYIFYYQIETTSNDVTATYRTIYGDIKTDRVFSGWIYGWGSLSKKSKYYITVKNNTPEGWIKARVIRDSDTLITKVHTTQIVIQ